ncbi:hypothetical protein [Marinomonas shanghaiensis]|uniref:hypothetical protein n=1 Tax=Marinomonas shanghaiensis TaxID=2202418 RepID=UPI003A922167
MATHARLAVSRAKTLTSHDRVIKKIKCLKIKPIKPLGFVTFATKKRDFLTKLTQKRNVLDYPPPERETDHKVKIFGAMMPHFFDLDNSSKDKN